MKSKSFAKAIDELENLIGEAPREGMDRLGELLDQIKPYVQDFSGQVEAQAESAKSKIEAEISQRPLATLGVLSLVAFGVGFFLGSRGRR